MTITLIGIIVAYYLVGFFPLRLTLQKAAKSDYEIRSLIELEEPGHFVVLILVWSVWVITIPVVLGIMYYAYRQKLHQEFWGRRFLRWMFNPKTRVKKEDYL